MVDYYSILNLPRNATQEQIRSAYLQMALHFHPDRSQGGSAETFKNLQAAYEVLSSKERRCMYDLYGVEDSTMPFEHPFSSKIATIGIRYALIVFQICAVLMLALIALFFVFLASYVDGHFAARDTSTLNDTTKHYWSYTKVCIPLLILEGVVALFLIAALLITHRHRVTIRSHLITAVYTMAFFAVIALTIIVPITKDSNDRVKLSAGSNYYSWRRHLIPLYIAAGLLFVLRVLCMHCLYKTCISYAHCGARSAWWCTVIFFTSNGLCEAAILALVVLIPLRADGVITTNYFVTLGLPCCVILITIGICLVSSRACLGQMQQEAAHVRKGKKFHIFIMALLTMVLTTIMLVCKRLNVLEKLEKGISGPVPSLSNAFIPIYILLALGTFFLITLLCVTVITLTSGGGFFPDHCEEMRTDEGGRSCSVVVSASQSFGKSTPGAPVVMTPFGVSEREELHAHSAFTPNHSTPTKPGLHDID
uniref:Putative DnaJ chaperone protein n=1 Tax=Trypanosoma vivax (strain Y486) TaxID=1055687 RepID=G0U5X3_TRYVY|nr:putative DnaJ chaperone protein [Trypanosoma vivax Y486]